MPANEQTWRKPSLMHAVFAVSSVLMLVATIWMMADDHNRAWKEYQRNFIALDSWTTKARMTETESAAYHKKLVDLQKELAAAQSTFTPADRDNVDLFLGNVLNFDEEFGKLVAEYHKDVSVVPDKDAVNKIHAEAAQLVEPKEAEVVRAGRTKLLAGLNKQLARFTFREDHFIQETKDKRAYFGEAQSLFDQAVGDGGSPAELDSRQKAVDAANKEVEISNKLTQRAIEQRQELERIEKLITADEDKAAKALKDHENTVNQLRQAANDRSLNAGKDLLTLPILDAFNSPLKDANRWLPQLPWNVNFRTVARFDRCETCHLGMEKALPGEPTKPAFPVAQNVVLELPTPAKRPAPADAKSAAAVDQSELAQVYGFRLAERGVFSTSDVTVSAVYPETPAAVAGLMTGDIIKTIGDAQIISPIQARQFLLETVNWGQPLKLTVSRGVPHPYTSHPRLDLYVGSVSPHPVDKFGCSICHQGQGSETSFNWATHTPNSPQQGAKWTQEYHWFENENWTYPMFPKRFQESTCLKCHHEVVDLEASKKFPEAPAPKVVEGYETIRRYGCFGCHEINGFAGPQQRIGPDLRTEPNYFAAAAQLEVDPGLAKLAPDAVALAKEVASNPDHETARRRLHELVANDATAKQPTLDAASHKLESVLRDSDTPGAIRKVGPSLRHVKSKLGFEFLTSWIANPTLFRPDTHMPRFFGVWDHLESGSRGLEESRRLEPVEIRAIAEYLLKSSQPFDYESPPEGVAAAEGGDHAAAIARGKKVFEVRGCLACHKHADFPRGMAVQGPDLSRIGAKLASNPDGRKWLYSWVRNPSRYHLRTYMPNLFLEPEEDTKGAKTDPAGDVTEYLMSSQQDWKPKNALKRDLTKEDEKAIEDLAVQYLSEKFPRDRALRYVTDGIPKGQAESVQGDEAVLVNLKPTGLAVKEPAAQGETAEHHQQRITRELDYVGRRSIGKYGCFGCHDIPGYEDAKPIGTALNDWGRKDPARLAFEHVDEYLEAHRNAFLPGAKASAPVSQAIGGDSAASSSAGAVKISAAANETNVEEAEASTLPELIEAMALSPDTSYFLGRVFEEDRIGFLWEKLRRPRSYDYKKTEEKKYNERLRMPQFTFAVDAAENQKKIESVMTFVLGLVAEPPPADYVATPSGAQGAIVAGRKVLEQFNCAGCHMLEMQRWEISYQPGAFGPPPRIGAEYPFVLPHVSPQEIAKADSTDRRDQRHATLVGMPLLDYKTGKPLKLDEDGSPIEPGDTMTKAFTPFMLFENAVVDGAVRLIGAQNMRIADSWIVREFPSRGGDLAKLLFPVVVADEVKINPAAKDKPNEAWGWLPPPLEGEGRKVQTGWLHDFLLDPFRIRPAAVLRMPKFNMSSAEASTLVHYFAAMDDAEYPYEFDSRTRIENVEAAEDTHPHYLEQALGIVTDNNYCIKCHKIGDFSPTGSVRAMAPRLDRVHSRLRPEYAHRWIADPVRLLPYTGMPVNIPEDKPIDQKLFKGSSDQQLNAVVDLLMNFDRLAQSQMSIKSRIKPAAPAAPAAANAKASGNSPASTAAKPATSKPDEDRSDGKESDDKTSEKSSDNRNPSNHVASAVSPRQDARLTHRHQPE